MKLVAHKVAATVLVGIAIITFFVGAQQFDKEVPVTAGWVAIGHLALGLIVWGFAGFFVVCGVTLGEESV